MKIEIRHICWRASSYLCWWNVGLENDSRTWTSHIGISASTWHALATVGWHLEPRSSCQPRCHSWILNRPAQPLPSLCLGKLQNVTPPMFWKAGGQVTLERGYMESWTRVNLGVFCASYGQEEAAQRRPLRAGSEWWRCTSRRRRRSPGPQ